MTDPVSGEGRPPARLGDRVVELRAADRERVEHAAAIALRSHRRIGEVLVAQGVIGEGDLFRALAHQRGFVSGHVEDLAREIDPALVRSVPRAFLEHHSVLPIGRVGSRVRVATCDPDAQLEDLVKALDAELEVCLLTPTDYRRLWSAVDAPARATVRHEGPRPEEDLLARHDLDARAIALFQALLLEAVGERASDVHLERYRDRVRIRLRVDGELRDLTHVHWNADDLIAVVNVVKVGAGLDIAERRLPQGGRMTRRAGEHAFDLRVQTQPTLHGEHVVIRLLPQDAALLSIEDLGFPAPLAQQYRRALDSPAGLVLVVGPTGSGKSTTLYAGLQILARDPSRKVLTIEDPIEYAIDGIQQTQARPEIGLSFANAMRAFVREDPDVILVGEIRDGETALEAIRASQTGHVVLTTLHCNDATDAVQRLVDLGMHPSSIASELLVVLAQRLARRVCLACRVEATPEPAILAELFPRGAPAGFRCFRGAGCDACSGHGTRGRIAVVEHLPAGPEVRRAIARRVPLDQLRSIALRAGLAPMRRAALELVTAGIVPLSEVPWILSPERMGEEA